MIEASLRLEALTKRYPGTTALDAVSFEVGRGTFHALLGGNGSGKSTLIKMLAGVEQGDVGGTLSLGTSSVDANHVTPAWSKAAGIRFVHQDLGLFETLTVAENMALTAGFDGRFGAVRWSAVRSHAAHLLRQVGLDVSPDARIQSLKPAQRTLVAIARALHERDGKPELLVLDEPTASLPDREVGSLLATLRQLVDAGTTVLYVTHRLAEVLQAADNLTVLRDGAHVSTRPVAGLDEDQLVELIVGRPVTSLFPDSVDTPSDVVLEVAGLEGGPVRGIDLSLRKGEILGIGGAVGSGRSSVLRLLFGDLRRDAGEIKINGRAVDLPTPTAAMRAGIAYVPENRGSEAAFATLAVSENLAASTFSRDSRGGWLSPLRERRAARRDVADFGIRTASVLAPFRSLSGGNQQKVVLGRWLRLNTNVLLLDEPTQGVDVGARSEIYELVRAAARDGLAVIVVSSDFEELAGLSDRVVVMAAGRVVAEAKTPAADRDWIAHKAHAAVVEVGAR